MGDHAAQLPWSGLRFRQDVPCVIVAEGYEVLMSSIRGFAIPPCVMNRIAFEQQRTNSVHRFNS